MGEYGQLVLDAKRHTLHALWAQPMNDAPSHARGSSTRAARCSCCSAIAAARRRRSALPHLRAITTIVNARGVVCSLVAVAFDGRRCTAGAWRRCCCVVPDALSREPPRAPSPWHGTSRQALPRFLAHPALRWPLAGVLTSETSLTPSGPRWRPRMAPGLIPHDAARSGSVKKNALPCPSVLSTQMRPPCPSTMHFEM